MIFAHDTEAALASVVALVNTGAGAEDGLASRSALDGFLSDHGWTGSRTHDAAELAAVRALRPRLRAIWTAGEDEAVSAVNALLREAGALPQLVRHDGWAYHLHATTPEAPLATRMAVEAAMALVDVIRAQELGRLKVCAEPGCGHVVVDLSKNRSRRYCDGGCGNRANVAAYRARKATAG